MNAASRSDAIPAPLLFIGSGIGQYSGSALGIAVLIPVIPGFAVAWWRVLVGALILLAWRRPWRQALTRRDVMWSAIFGVALTAMNMTFYESIARIPMGTAVSVEFVGPVLTALIAGGGWRTRVGALATACGVVSIGGFGLDLSDPAQAWGMGWALAAGLAWAAYITLGTHIAHRRSGLDSLAIGLAAGVVVTAPFVGGHIGEVNSLPLLAAAVGVGIMSTALPLPLEQLAMKRLGADLFALMAAILPATSVIIGAITLRQIPNVGEIVGIGLITAGITLVRWSPGAAKKLRDKLGKR